MRVRLLTAATQWGGTEEHTAALASTLEARGHDVAIVELGRNGYAQRQAGRQILTPLVHVPLDRSPSRLDKPLREVGWIAWWRILKRLRADVGVVMKGGYDMTSRPLDVAARLCFGRYITIEASACPMPAKASRRHFNASLPGMGLWWYRLLWRRRLHSAWPHAVVCVSDAVRRPLARDYRFSAQKLFTVHNGVDVEKFRPDARLRLEMRARWAARPDTLVFGAVGRLAPVKGYEIAIEAFEQLVALGGRDVRLVLVGDGASRGGLERLVREKGLGDRIILPGFTDQPQDTYPAIDVFLMPSKNEGLPLALIEAMACQCCPIAMDVGGVSEVIVDRGLGWVVPPDDRRSFVEAMIAAAQMSQADLTTMGERARQHVVSRFDARIQLAALADLIEG